MQRAEAVVDHLFRQQAGQMVSTLTRIFGSQRLELAEEVVQDALLKALELWPRDGVPSNPGGWLMQVAKNRALDVLRREASMRERMPEIERSFAETASWNTDAEQAFADDQLSMMFLCCHPALTREARVALTLKTVGGFGVAEIARAFMAQESTIAQRLVRAKRQIRDESLSFDMPAESQLPDRLDSVLDVLYLLFNEGYCAHEGEDLIRADLCDEAIRLCRLTSQHPRCDVPKTHALLALMLLQHARRAARISAAGELWGMRVQNRGLWDRAMIAEGLLHLDRSARGETMTEYHLQAGIAAAHAVAPTYMDTDWLHIADLYDQLYSINPTPVIGLNRGVALAQRSGPQAGIEALAAIEHHATLSRYHLLYAVLAELWREAGDTEKAAGYYRAALECDCTEPERRFLMSRLEQLCPASS